jgi:hydrogenase-1 operon protein HyaF
MDGATLHYIDMPKEMATFEKPLTLASFDISRLTAAREATDWLCAALATYQPCGAPSIANLSGLDEANRTFINELVGEGEVSVNYRGDFNARAQESVLAGVWRCHYLDDQGDVSHDLLEVGDVPNLARLLDPARQLPASALAEVNVPPGLMNAKPILTELIAHAESYQPGAPAHTINLSLLPMSEEDIAFLDNTLGKGPVEILSRSYGQCRMSNTAVANIWWVRFFNSTGTLILNSLEVVDVPLVARAAVEDIADSGRRLMEILESEGLAAGP